MSRRSFPNSFKSLLHFNLPYYKEPGALLKDEIGIETWQKNGDAKFVGTYLPNDATVAGTPWNGYLCLQTAQPTDFISCPNDSHIWDIHSDGNYEIEMFVRPTSITGGNILTMGDTVLGLSTSNQLSLISTTFGLSLTTSGTLTINEWNHVLIRLTGGSASIFINGAAVGSAAMTAGVTITPTLVKIGGFQGQVDEFLFKHTAKTGNPTVPTEPYTGKLNARTAGIDFGDGSFGDVALSAADTQINTYTIVQEVQTPTTLRIETATSASTGVYGTFAAGQEVMFHVSAKKGSDENLLGKYAFRRIVAVSGTVIFIDQELGAANENEFELSADTLSKYYVQMVMAPNFDNATVSENATIIPKTWDTSRGGGIVVFKTKGDLTINGKIIVGLTGPNRDDSYSLTHADIIDRFILTGNVFIACGGTLTASANARIGMPYAGDVEGGAGGTSAISGYSVSVGQNGQVGYGGAGGIGANPNSGFGGLPGRPGEGGFDGATSQTTPIKSENGKACPPLIIFIVKAIEIDKAAISVGGGGGGAGAGGYNFGNVGSGGGGAFLGNELGNGPGAGGKGADVNGVGGTGTTGEYGNSHRLGTYGGNPSGSGFGGGGGGSGVGGSYRGTGGGGSGTGFAYIAIIEPIAA
jgi:hypothetical protein